MTLSVRNDPHNGPIQLVRDIPRLLCAKGCFQSIRRQSQQPTAMPRSRAQSTEFNKALKKATPDARGFLPNTWDHPSSLEARPGSSEVPVRLLKQAVQFIQRQYFHSIRHHSVAGQAIPKELIQLPESSSDRISGMSHELGLLSPY